MSPTVFTVVPYLALGALIGAVHAGLLYRAVMMLAGSARASTQAAWHLARFGFVILAFWLVARQGAVALLSVAAGFTAAQIVARQVMGPK
jgi:hypothetical protein